MACDVITLGDTAERAAEMIEIRCGRAVRSRGVAISGAAACGAGPLYCQPAGGVLRLLVCGLSVLSHRSALMVALRSG
jgi:hypothetical protein